MVTKCKFCNAPIRWLTTTAGKKMPVDADSRQYWRKDGGKSRIVTAQGEVFACEYDGEGQESGYGYVPHWASCSNYNRRNGA